MATPEIDNLALPTGVILVLPDSAGSSTGMIFRKSPMGSGPFQSMTGELGGHIESNHVLFVEKMATEVKIDGVKYQAMNWRAVVGLIPE